MWYPPPIAQLMWIAGRGVAMLRGRFEAFTAGEASPVGEELMPVARTAGPPRLNGAG